MAVLALAANHKQLSKPAKVVTLAVGFAGLGAGAVQANQYYKQLDKTFVPPPPLQENKQMAEGAGVGAAVGAVLGMVGFHVPTQDRAIGRVFQKMQSISMTPRGFRLGFLW